MVGVAVALLLVRQEQTNWQIKNQLPEIPLQEWQHLNDKDKTQTKNWVMDVAD
jgi:hypothetical protein